MLRVEHHHSIQGTAVRWESACICSGVRCLFIVGKCYFVLVVVWVRVSVSSLLQKKKLVTAVEFRRSNERTIVAFNFKFNHAKPGRNDCAGCWYVYSLLLIENAKEFLPKMIPNTHRISESAVFASFSHFSLARCTVRNSLCASNVRQHQKHTAWVNTTARERTETYAKEIFSILVWLGVDENCNRIPN